MINCSTVRMTASRAAELFRTASPITAAELAEQHLDMLQMSDISIELRGDLSFASDVLEAGKRDIALVRRVVAAYNARAGR